MPHAFHSASTHCPLPLPPTVSHLIHLELIQSEQDATKSTVANLERENKLLATAWYDLTCRLQSNTVMLARRQEPPKSWLGKQRAAVAGAGGGAIVSFPQREWLSRVVC
jgi:hypothetical protein